MELVLFPRLLRRLWIEAPNIDVRIVNLDAQANADLAEGRLDLAMGVVGQFGDADAPRGLRSQDLVSDGFICVVREGHPVVKKRLSLDDFVALPHALVSSRREAKAAASSIRRSLASERSGASPWRSRTSSSRRMSFARTDLLLTLAARVAASLAPLLGLRRIPPPLELPT